MDVRFAWGAILNCYYSGKFRRRKTRCKQTCLPHAMPRYLSDQMEAAHRNTRTYIQRGREDLIDQTCRTPKENGKSRSNQNKYYAQIVELASLVLLSLSLRGNVNPSLVLQSPSVALWIARRRHFLPQPACG
jgi:hypothetical protein